MNVWLRLIESWDCANALAVSGPPAEEPNLWLSLAAIVLGVVLGADAIRRWRK